VISVTGRHGSPKLPAGWVKKRFAELDLYRASGISVLWNTFRDAVGKAISEFNEAMSGTDDYVRSGDCTANGKYCLRAQRHHKQGDPRSVELFLNEKSRTVDQRLEPGESGPICGYRASEDLSHLEFYSLDEEFKPVPGLPEGASEPSMTISAELVCEMALAEFLFNPEPRPFRIEPK
jgi:hypothetical protein